MMNLWTGLAVLLASGFGAQTESRDAAAPVPLPSTPWNLNGTPLLGTYTFGKEPLEDFRQAAEAGMSVLIAGSEAMDPATPEGAFCRDKGLKFLYHLTKHLYHGVRLREPVSADQTTIPLYFASRIPQKDSRLVRIDDELVRYEALTEEGLTGCERGVDGTTPAAHHEGVILFWPEECARDVESAIDSPNLFGFYVLDDSPGDARSALRALYETVRRFDPDVRYPVCAGYGDAGSVVNFGPGVCDVMLLYWYPVSTTSYRRESTAAEVQRILLAARSRVPGVPFVGVYQAFDGSAAQTGQGMPTGEQLREQLEDFVRAGASGLVAFLCRGGGLPGWGDAPELAAAIRKANEEIRATGALEVRPETEAMARKRLELTDSGEDPGAVPGVVPAWRIVGPFEDAEERGLDAPFPPDADSDFDAVYPVKFGRAGWRVWPTTCGVVGFTAIYGPHDQLHNCVAYAACEVTSPVEQTVLMRLHTDDDAWVRLNDEEVYRFEGSRGLDYDKDAVTVTLPAGTSPIRVKVYNRRGMWGFTMRFTNRDGNPLEGLEFSPPPE